MHTYTVVIFYRFILGVDNLLIVIGVSNTSNTACNLIYYTCGLVQWALKLQIK